MYTFHRLGRERQLSDARIIASEVKRFPSRLVIITRLALFVPFEGLITPHAAARAETAADENWACFEDANATREAAEKTAQALLEQLAEVEALAATTTANATADVASATQAARERFGRAHV